MNSKPRRALARLVLPWAAAAFLAVGSALAGPATAVPALHAASCTATEYENVDGACVHRPEAAPTAPDGATARCGDGTYSFSRHRSGTCSSHGGVANWL